MFSMSYGISSKSIKKKHSSVICSVSSCPLEWKVGNYGVSGCPPGSVKGGVKNYHVIRITCHVIYCFSWKQCQTTFIFLSKLYFYQEICKISLVQYITYFLFYIECGYILYWTLIHILQYITIKFYSYTCVHISKTLFPIRLTLFQTELLLFPIWMPLVNTFLVSMHCFHPGKPVAAKAVLIPNAVDKQVHDNWHLE